MNCEFMQILLQFRVLAESRKTLGRMNLGAFN